MHEKKKRKRQQSEAEFIRSYGGSTLDQARASKNERFMRVMRGAEPSPDTRVTGSKTAHYGKYGAPDIYYEQSGGRRGGKGKRVGR